MTPLMAQGISSSEAKIGTGLWAALILTLLKETTAMTIFLATTATTLWWTVDQAGAVKTFSKGEEGMML